MPEGVPPAGKRPAPSSKSDAAAIGRRPTTLPSTAAPTSQGPVRGVGSSTVDERHAQKHHRSSFNIALGMIGGGSEGSSQNCGRNPIANSLSITSCTKGHNLGSASFGSVYEEITGPMPSQENYFTNLLNEDGLEVSGSEDVVEADYDLLEPVLAADMSSQTKSKGRSKNFSEEEDMLLISAYLNVSKDPIAGRDQKDGRFWERIEKYYYENKTFESDRNWSSLRHRWTTVSKEVSLFNSYYEAIERKNESGKTINDKLAEAKGTYQRLRKRAFSLFHAWNVLRFEPKWVSIKDDKPPVDGNDGAALNVERPPGRKAEKEKLRARKWEEDACDPFIEEVKNERSKVG